MSLSLEEARALHDEVCVLDLHADTAKLMDRVDYDLAARHERPMPRAVNYLGHVDLPRLREGGVAAQFFSFWTVPYPERGCAHSVDRQLDALDRAMAAHPTELTWARTGAEIRAAKARGAVAALGGIEGGQALEGDLAHRRGRAGRLSLLRAFERGLVAGLVGLAGLAGGLALAARAEEPDEPDEPEEPQHDPPGERGTSA